MKKVLIVINSLEIGGAEKYLLRLLSHVQEKDIYIQLYPLKFKGKLVDSFKKLPIDLIDTSNYSFIKHFFELKKVISKSSLVLSFLYKSDLIVIVTKLLFNLKTPIVWNIRYSKTSFLGNKLSTFINIRINSAFSKYVNAITYNSESALFSHKKIGYKFKREFFLPNGFLTNPKVKTTSFGSGSRQLIIGNLSRFDFQKNHHFLIKGFSKIINKTPYDIYLLLVGRNVLSKKISKLISKLNLEEKVFRFDQVTNTSLFFEIIDIYVSTSRSESFSNSIAEAVFAEKKILVSNVGDNSLYFSPISIYENYDLSDFENKLNLIISNINKNIDYSLFKEIFSLSNSVRIFLDIIDKAIK